MCTIDTLCHFTIHIIELEFANIYFFSYFLSITGWSYLGSSIIVGSFLLLITLVFALFSPARLFPLLFFILICAGLCYGTPLVGFSTCYFHFHLGAILKFLLQIQFKFRLCKNASCIVELST